MYRFEEIYFKKISEFYIKHPKLRQFHFLFKVKNFILTNSSLIGFSLISFVLWYIRPVEKIHVLGGKIHAILGVDISTYIFVVFIVLSTFLTVRYLASLFSVYVLKKGRGSLIGIDRVDGHE